MSKSMFYLHRSVEITLKNLNCGNSDHFQRSLNTKLLTGGALVRVSFAFQTAPSIVGA